MELKGGRTRSTRKEKKTERSKPEKASWMLDRGGELAGGCVVDLIGEFGPVDREREMWTWSLKWSFTKVACYLIEC